MNELDRQASATPTIANPRNLLASPRHTMILLGILMILLVAGVMNASQNMTASQVSDPAQMIKTDLFMIGMLWYWAFFIYQGMQAYRHSILEFFDFKPFTAYKALGDIAYAALAFALIYACSAGAHHFLPDASPTNNPFLSAKPEGPLGIAVWLILSISAGICEEIVFRGYLQRQLALMTGKLGVAILLQGIVFGIGHAYEGLGSVAGIVLHGLILGLFAHWRGNIRAGILEHAAWDILAGFGLIGANW